MRLECLIYGLLAAFLLPEHSTEEGGIWSPINGRVAGGEIEKKGGCWRAKNGGGVTTGVTKWGYIFRKLGLQNSVFRIRVQG